jgi:signal transduction histidine kinase
MTALRTSLTSDGGLRLLRIVRWLLPLALASVALLFELNEHVAEGAQEIEPWFYAEIVLFAVLGPVAVFVTLLWVERLVTAYHETSAELAVMNRDLESRIEERTAHLAEAGEQLRAANEELARANEELRQLDRLKSEFVSLVSHQLRAPLTNINGALEIVAQDADSLPVNTQRTLRILIHEGQRLSWLIQTILDVSRIEAGRLQPRLGPVAVGPLLADACAATLGVEPDQPHQLRVAEGLPPAWADETLLGEVMRNLIENAMRYSKAGADVDVATERVDDSIEIAVSDQGEGVPPEEQERIFQSFHRVTDDESSVKGSGLGLYFADRLVRAMGGSISVESPIWPDDDAPGARFSVRVPIAEDAPEDGLPTEGDDRTDEA